jgi:hypothetical protein
MSKDPLTDNYLALIVSIVWYRQIVPEQAFRIIDGKSNMKPECRNVTPEMVASMARITGSKNFKSWDKLERSFRVNRYQINELVRQYRISQITKIFRQIQVRGEAFR